MWDPLQASITFYKLSLRIFTGLTWSRRSNSIISSLRDLGCFLPQIFISSGKSSEGPPTLKSSELVLNDQLFKKYVLVMC